MFTVKGIIKDILPERIISEKYKCKEIILEVKSGEYTKQIGFEFFGDKIELLTGYGEGEEVEVFFNIDARMWNERVFNNVRAWRIQRVKEEKKVVVLSDQKSSALNNEDNGGSDDLPF